MASRRRLPAGTGEPSTKVAKTLIVVGGGLGVAAYDEILAPMWQELSARVLPPTISHLKIVCSTLSTTALGAAALAFVDGERLAGRDELPLEPPDLPADRLVRW